MRKRSASSTAPNPPAQKRYSLKDLLKQIRPENQPPLIDWGPPVGGPSPREKFCLRTTSIPCRFRFLYPCPGWPRSARFSAVREPASLDTALQEFAGLIIFQAKFPSAS